MTTKFDSTIGLRADLIATKVDKNISALHVTFNILFDICNEAPQFFCPYMNFASPKHVNDKM